MKGDFTRSTFSPQKHYTSVRMQQGRLQLDSDWNEQVDIQQHLQNAQAVDVIGSTTGVSTVDIQTGLFTNEAFKLLEINNGLSNGNLKTDIAILPGHLYVYGILCELSKEPVFTGEFNPSDPKNIKVESLIIGDRPFEIGEWLIADDENDEDNYLKGLQITAIDKISCILTLSNSSHLERIRQVPTNEDTSKKTLQTKSLRRILTYCTQPDYPNPTPLDPLKSGGQYLAYIDVWQRHITALDDPTIRDIALNVPDTTTRTKTVWQLKLKEVTEQTTLSLEEKQEIAKNQVIENQWLTLSEEEKQTLDDKAKKQKIAEKWDILSETEKQKILKPEERQKILQEAENQKIAEKCATQWDNFWKQERDRSPQLTASMKKSQINGRSINIQQLGNQLYRVEIHRGSRSENDAPTDATFKWSRNNGMIASSIQSIQNDVINIKRSIQDAWSDSELGQWIEIITEEMELKGEPGILVSLKQINETTLKFDDAHVRSQLAKILNDQGIPKSPAKVRRWDYTTSTETVQGAISIQQDGKNIPIESGIQVTFAQGQEYQTRDYWLIPARSNSNDIEWPKDSEGRSIPQSRRGIKHNYSLLAIISPQKTQNQTQTKETQDEISVKHPYFKIQDKRVLFTPLSNVVDVKMFESHAENKNNPHQVTAAQIDINADGSKNQIINQINSLENDKVRINIQRLDENVDNHIEDKENNPHQVTAAQIDINADGSKNQIINQINSLENDKVRINIQRLDENVDKHIEDKENNPHQVTAEQIDINADGSKNRIINQINSSENDSVRINIERLDENIALKSQVLLLTDGEIKGIVNITASEEDKNTNLSSPPTLLDVKGQIKAYDVSTQSFTQLSSQNFKKDVADFSTEENSKILEELKPIKFKFNNEDNINIGFISENTPNLLTSSDGKSIKIMNLIAVLTKSVQDNRQEIQHLVQKIDQQSQEIQHLVEENTKLKVKKEETKKTSFWNRPLFKKHPSLLNKIEND